MILGVDDVAASYQRLEILHGVSLHVAPCEVVAIIGPNGAGKSTVLKTVMGYLRPSRGRVIFEDREITGLRTDEIAARGLGYVPQGRIVFLQMTVLENLEMGAYLVRDPAEVQGTLERIFDLFPVLADRRRQRAGSMSGGEQQMLAIARALMLHPKLLLLDEPSLGLSPKYVDLVFGKIQQLNRQGVAMLIVEQNARRVLGIAHRGYVLDMGCNRLDGPGSALLNDEEVKRLYLGYHATRFREQKAAPEPGRMGPF